VLLIISLTLFMLLVGIDPPKFYLLTGQTEKAHKAIERIYHTCGDQMKINNISAFLLKTSGETKVEVSFKEAFFDDEKYVRPSRISVLVMAFQVLTCYYSLIAYSCTIFTDEFPVGFPMTPRIGAQIVASANLVGSVCSLYFIHRYGRRQIFLFGMGIIAFFLFCMSIVSAFELPWALLLLMSSVTFVF